MAETKSPVAALQAKDIPSRAAGARDLGNKGGVEHIELLLRVATGDASPGVRLAAAAAAADILSRCRLSADRGALDDGARASILAQASSADPSVNTGLFQVSGTLGTAAGLARIGAAMRDPRFDVRAGALVGLWRHCASASVNGNAETEATVVALLREARALPATRAEVARVCANVGYATALAPALDLEPLVDRGARKVLDEATARLRNPPSIVGAWVDPGHDLGEIDPSAEIAGHAVMMGSGDGVVILGKAKPMRGPLPRPWRVCWAKAPGADTAGPVMQVSERSWFPAGGEDIGAFADACIAAKRWKDLAAAEDSIAHAAARLRVRGTRLLAQGDAKGAREALEAAIAEKRVPTDTYWYLAEALRQCRRGKDAKPHLEKYLAKAGKKGAFVAEATKRLAGK